MNWAARLKRVFNIDIHKSAGQPICTAAGGREAVGHRDVPDETCEQCGGAVKIIASIEDPVVIKKILEHCKRKRQHSPRVTPQARRAPPTTLPLVFD